MKLRTILFDPISAGQDTIEDGKDVETDDGDTGVRLLRVYERSQTLLIVVDPQTNKLVCTLSSHEKDDCVCLADATGRLRTYQILKYAKDKPEAERATGNDFVLLDDTQLEFPKR